MEKPKKSSPLLIRIVIRIFGFIYGLFHLMFLISYGILSLQSSFSPDLMSVLILLVALLGTVAGYWMLLARYSTFFRKLLIGISLSLFLLGTVGMMLVAPHLV